MGPPMEGALDSVRKLLREGHEVFVHTSKALSLSGHKAVSDWLDYYEFPDMHVIEKPAADVYVDDKAVEFIDWIDVVQVVEERE